MRNGITSRLASRRSSAQRLMVRVFTLLTLMVSLIPRSSQATVIDWSSTASTSAWATGSNWVGNTAPANSLVTDIARFDKTSYLNQPNSGTTSINGIQIGDGTTATAVLTLTNTALSIGGSGITMFANAGAATLTGGSVKIGANQSWSNNSSSLLTISSNITNTGNTTPFTLTLNGSGTGGTTISGIISDGGTTGTTAVTVNRTSGVTTLSGANTYTGGTTLNAGTLNINSATALGGTAGTFVINGGTIDNTTAGAITLTNNNAITWGGDFTFGGTNNLSLGTGAETISADQTITLNGTNSMLTMGSLANTTNGSGRTITVNGAGNTLVLGGYTISANNSNRIGTFNGNGNVTITGAVVNGGTSTSGLTYSGTGTLTLSGTNTYDGATSVTSGILNIQNASALGGTTNGTTVSSGATLQLQNNITVGAEALTISGTGASGQNGVLVNVSGTNNYGGLLTLGAASTISSDSGTLNLTNSGTITGATFGLTLTGSGNGSISSIIGTTSGALTKSGTGSWTLSGANTYTGGTTINGGTLVVNSASSLGATSGGATINAGTLEVATGYSASRTFTLGDAASTFQIDPSQTFTVTSAIGGSGALNKTGSGTMVLSASNTYSGGTILTAGTLQMSGSGTLGTTSGALTVDGGTFDLNGTSQGVGNFTGSGGTILNNSTGTNVTLTIGNSNGTGGNYAGVIADHTSGTGTVGLTKAGTGTISLSGANTYTGGTTINAGTLQLGNANTSSGGALGKTTSASVTFGAGSTGKLQLNGNATTIIDLNTNATVGTPIIENGSSTAAAILTVNTANTDTYAGLLQNGSTQTLGLTKSGSGTLILTGLTNSQTGITNINGGILRASDITTYAAGNQTITSSILGQAAFNGVSFNGNNATLQLRYNGQSDSTSQTLTLPTNKGGALLVNASAPNATIDVDRQGGSGTNKTIAFTSSTVATLSTLNVTGGDGYSLGLGNLVVGSGGSAGNATVNPTTANLTIGTATSSGTTNNHTLVLSGTSSGNTITGAMADGGSSSVLSVTKQNTSSWTLSGASTYTGATTVSGGILSVDNNNATSARIAGTTLVTVNAGGTLLLSQSGGTASTDRINNSATMTLNGGTFSTGGLSEHGASNNTAGIGALTLQSTSIIDTGNVASIVAFADSKLSTWTGTLNIYNWSGTPLTGGGTDQLYFGSDATGLTAAQLVDIQFYSGNGTGAYGAGALILANGEVVPVPEPSTYIVGILALSVIGYHQHRRRLHLMRRRHGGRRPL